MDCEGKAEEECGGCDISASLVGDHPQYPPQMLLERWHARDTTHGMRFPRHWDKFLTLFSPSVGAQVPDEPRRHCSHSLQKVPGGC